MAIATESEEGGTETRAEEEELEDGVEDSGGDAGDASAGWADAGL